MELSCLTIADLHAAKSQAKEKESHYRSIKNVTPELGESYIFWADLLHTVDTELTNRLLALK